MGRGGRGGVGLRAGRRRRRRRAYLALHAVRRQEVIDRRLPSGDGIAPEDALDRGEAREAEEVAHRLAEHVGVHEDVKAGAFQRVAVAPVVEGQRDDLVHGRLDAFVEAGPGALARGRDGQENHAEVCPREAGQDPAQEHAVGLVRSEEFGNEPDARRAPPGGGGGCVGRRRRGRGRGHGHLAEHRARAQEERGRERLELPVVVGAGVGEVKVDALHRPDGVGDAHVARGHEGREAVPEILARRRKVGGRARDGWKREGPPHEQAVVAAECVGGGVLLSAEL